MWMRKCFTSCRSQRAMTLLASIRTLPTDSPRITTIGNCYLQIEFEFLYGFLILNRMGNKTKFTHDYIVPLNVEGMLVECRSADEKRILQEDAFSFVQYQKSSPNLDIDRKASVIMYGIDTVSRTNLRRLMPVVFGFLKSPGWYEMMGYNKVRN